MPELLAGDKLIFVTDDDAGTTLILRSNRSDVVQPVSVPKQALRRNLHLLRERILAEAAAACEGSAPPPA